MRRLRYTRRLLSEFVGFARQNKAYWIVPLIVLLGLASLLIVSSEAVAPLIYTLF